MPDKSPKSKDASTPNPFRRAVLRGLGVLLPPLLTIAVLLWALNLVQAYVLGPVESGANHVITWCIWDSPETPNDASDYVQLANGQWVPEKIHQRVSEDPGDLPPTSAKGYFHRYVKLEHLHATTVVPLFGALFVLILYFLGKIMAARLGRWVWSVLERGILQLPIVSSVYTSVKQITDFLFSESEIEFNRVVAVEYPRKGIWSVGFVTGESMADIRAAANEPVLSVLMPTSPMPATGFTVTVLKSETVDLDITVDQAIQFVMSCGVVIPESQQQVSETGAAIAEAVAARESLLQAQQQEEGLKDSPLTEPQTVILPAEQAAAVREELQEPTTVALTAEQAAEQEALAEQQAAEFPGEDESVRD